MDSTVTAGGLRDQFEQFYALDAGAVRAAVESGLITTDTNVLLNLYRFQAAAREDLFKALEGVRDRLWIPYQVGLEFHRRRLDVIAEQEAYFASSQRELKRLTDGLRNKVGDFPTRIGLSEARTKEILDSIGELSSALSGEVTKAGRANEVRLSDFEADRVLERLEALFEKRVGQPMSPAELAEARKEAQRRVDAKIPPGYEDGAKADPAGDYLIFRQLMTEAKTRALPVVLVTDDEKPDWYRKQQGKPLGARPELRAEMMAEAGVPLLAMTTESFLRNVKKYLHVEVAPETLDQAKKLPVIVEEDQRSAMERILALQAGDDYREQVQRLRGPQAFDDLASLSDEQRATVARYIEEAAIRARPKDTESSERLRRWWALLGTSQPRDRVSGQQASSDESEQE